MSTVTIGKRTIRLKVLSVLVVVTFIGLAGAVFAVGPLFVSQTTKSSTTTVTGGTVTTTTGTALEVDELWTTTIITGTQTLTQTVSSTTNINCPGSPPYC